MSGKGDNRRPTDEKAYSDNYDRIFGKNKTPDRTEIVEGKEVVIKASKRVNLHIEGNKQYFEYRTEDGEVIGGKCFELIGYPPANFINPT